MRVLYLALQQEFPAPHAGFSHVYSVIKGLRKLGHEIFLVCKATNENEIGKWKNYDGFEVLSTKWHLDYLPPTVNRPYERCMQLTTFEIPRAAAKLRKLVEEKKIDIIHERHDMRFDLSGLVGKLSSVPSVLEVNSPFLEECFGEHSIGYHLRNFSRRMSFSLASSVVVQTRILKGIIDANTGVSSRVIPNGADPEVFHPREKAFSKLKLDELKDSVVVGFAGAFKPWHGVDTLVEAAKGLNVKLLLIGGNAKVDNGISVGAIAHEDVPDYLNLCDILVSPFAPSLDEARKEMYKKYGMWWCPLKVFEYMAMGKPVISSKVGEVPEYIEGAGLTYEEGDVAGLRSALERLSADEALRRRLGERGRARVSELYSWDKVAKETAKLYGELVG